MLGLKNRHAVTFTGTQASAKLRRRNLKTQLYFYQLGQPSALIRYEHGTFQKASLN